MLGLHFRTIVDALRHRATVMPTAPWLTVVAADGGSTTLDAATTDAESRVLAAWLRTEREVQPGEVVGVIPRNDTRSVLAVLAVLRAGATALLLNPADPPARLEEQVEAAAARTVLRSPSVPSDGTTDTHTVPDRGTAGRADGWEPALDPSSTALLFGTSGSTAAAKLVMQSHRNAVANAVAVGHHHGLAPGQRVLSCLPVHHVNAMHLTVFATLTSGAHAVLVQGFDPFAFLGVVGTHRPRIVSGAPPMLEALVAARRTTKLPGELEYFVSAAAPLTSATARAVGDRLGLRVLQGYGLTETTNFSTTIPRGLSDDDHRRLTIDTDIPSVGVALTCNEVVVLDDAGDPVPDGEVGEVCMRGANVMRGYLDNPTETAHALRGGWFHSQDLGRMVGAPDGRRYLTLTGRSKNMAKVMGETVSLDEMDRVLRAHPGVADAACVHVPHRFAGEEIVAVVALDPALGSETPTDTEIQAALRARFPAAVVPRRITRVERVPRSPTGKLQRPGLAALVDPGPTR